MFVETQEYGYLNLDHVTRAVPDDGDALTLVHVDGSRLTIRGDDARAVRRALQPYPPQTQEVLRAMRELTAALRHFPGSVRLRY